LGLPNQGAHNTPDETLDLIPATLPTLLTRDASTGVRDRFEPGGGDRMVARLTVSVRSAGQFGEGVADGVPQPDVVGGEDLRAHRGHALNAILFEFGELDQLLTNSDSLIKSQRTATRPITPGTPDAAQRRRRLRRARRVRARHFDSSRAHGLSLVDPSTTGPIVSPAPLDGTG
jgi:hypothetical protein